jgi:hypothetical protein
MMAESVRIICISQTFSFVAELFIKPFKSVTTPKIFLIDNGSLRPQATFWLRCLAEALGEQTGLPVEPVSLLHSHKIPAGDLGGTPATIVKRRLREHLQTGHRRFIFLPLFLGPSLAISEYLPEIVAEQQALHPDLEVSIAEPLAGSSVDAPDPALAQLLADQVRALQPCAETRIALVDHGTPIEPVNRVRNAVARQLAEILRRPVEACSMERREGADYAFNEPLLESLGQSPASSTLPGPRLLLAMFFLLPGRHAGEGGDVAEIAQGLVDGGRFRSVETAPLLGEHPGLLALLRQRLEACL